METKFMKPKPEFWIEPSRVYSSQYTPPPLQVAFTIQDEIITPVGGICIFTGLPKNGKTFFMCAAISSYFLNDTLFQMRLKLPTEKPLITLFDTESPENSFYKNVDLIKSFANGRFNENNFMAYRLRGLNPDEMIAIIKNYVINTPLCGCIIIDGLIDLVIDENNSNEVKHVDTMLKELTNTYKVTIFAVLHTNRGGNDTNGKLGSKMDKTADSTLLIKKSKEQKNVYELSGTLLRYAKKELDIISINREQDKIFEVETEAPFKQRTFKDWTLQEHKQLASRTVIEAGNTYNEIIEDVKESQACGISYSKKIVKIWIDEKIISKRHDKKYYYNG